VTSTKNIEEVSLDEVKITPKIKLDLGTKKKSSLISINSSLETDLELDKQKISQYNKRDLYFSESKLIECWRELVIFIKDKGKFNLGITLGVHTPMLKNNYLIEFPLSNAAQAEMILEEKYVILDYLRNKLQNDKIELSTKIVEDAEKTNNVPYTNKDKFKKLLDENPQLEILRVKLGLDPDY
jgi:hypothetical protein